VTVLAGNGANIDHRNKLDLSPLIIAIMKNFPKIVEFLLKRGAKLDLETKSEFA
jgi:ankyrin repeat protein